MVSVQEAQLALPVALGQAQIKVVGVGGGGVNAVRRMGTVEIPGVELLGVNTDAVSLKSAGALRTLAIGTELTRGLGSGGNPEIGRRAAEESHQAIAEALKGADLVFVAAGMGGGTGTGAAPVVARIAREIGAVAVGIVTSPFGFEGARRMTIATAGMRPLREAADTVIMVSNDRLLTLAGKRATVQDSFMKADKVMTDSILAVSRVVNVPGDINVDFADVRAVMGQGGAGLIAIGQGEGPQRVMTAARTAFEHPLVEISGHGAKTLIFVVTGGPDLTMRELNEAGAYVNGMVDEDAQIFFGMHIDEERKQEAPVEVVLIATRLPAEQGGPNVSGLSVAQKVRLAAARYHVHDELPAFLRDSDGPSPRPGMN